VRWSLTTLWDTYDRRFGFTPTAENSSQALGAIYSSPSVGTTQFPMLAQLQSALGSLANNPAFQLNLGATNLRVQIRKTFTPLALELGITNWLSVRAALPLVLANGESLLDVNPAGNEGNVGANPASQFLAARNTNTSARNQFTVAANTLQQRVDACMAMPGEPGCDALLPRIADAQALVTQSRNFRDLMESVYGSDTVSAHPFVPLTGSAMHLAIDSRIAAFNALYRELLFLDPSEADPLAARPIPAQTVLTATQFRSLLESPEFGISLLPLLSYQRQGFGDLELGVRIRVFDSFATRDDGSPGARLAMSVLARLATGLAPDQAVPLDVGTGDGQSDIEFGGAGDLRLTRGLLLALQGRFGVQMADQRGMRVAPPGTPYPELFTLRNVSRNMGDYFDFSVRPSLRVGPFASLSGAYYFYSKTADSYTGNFLASSAETGREPITLDATVLEDGTAITVQRAGIGLRIGNFADRADAVIGTPVEFSAMYMKLLSSTGYGVPDAGTVVLQLRLHTRLFGPKKAAVAEER
jgi:hypothetical protein